MFEIGSFIKDDTGHRYKVIAKSKYFNLLETDEYESHTFTVEDIEEFRTVEEWANDQQDKEDLVGDLCGIKRNKFYCWMFKEDIRALNMELYNPNVMETE